jgi:hypothetical protein
MQCSQCGEEVSDRTTSCPVCGQAMPASPGAAGSASAIPPPAERHRQQPAHVVIEQTGKKWKAIQAVGVVAMLVGIGLMVTVPGYPSIGFSVIACCIAAYGRIGAWWHHG